MSIFSKTITKAINDYRYLLRRHLDQAARMTKLQVFDLKNAELYENDIALFQTAQAIVADIEKNMSTQSNGYYAYSGIDQFCEYLKEYLSYYEIEDDRLVHKVQKASRALIQAIQLSATPRDCLSDKIAVQLFECNKTVVNLGSSEQWDLHLQTLERQQRQNPGFYTRIIAHLQSMISARMGERSVA